MPAHTTTRLASRRYSFGLGITGEALRYFKYWLLAAFLVSFLLPLALSRYADLDLSIWYYTANVAKWFTAFVAGGFLFALVPSMIAAGLTRRELSVSLGVFGVLWSAALGALAIAGFLAERAYYGANGWTHGVDTGDSIVSLGTWSETAAFAAVYPLVYLVHFAAGAVIGAAVYRWESTGWMLVFPILPVVFSLDNAMYDLEPFGPGWAGFLGRYMDDWGRGLILGGVVLVLLGLALAAHRLLIDIPLRAKKA